MGVVEPGQILVGKYRVDRVLGQGGMGIVVQATHVQLEERVAVKFLLEEYAKHPESAARFLREARAAVKIKSEHVARVIDVGTLETGAPYMVMEFLSGRDLSEVLEAQGPLPIQDAIDYILQASEAIAEAHAAGIVHRDLKPANLFLTRRADDSPVVKVLDFGISKVMVPSDSGPDMSLTKTSAMMGSPLYMSPEQMRSARDVDARSDIWSLGAILYELLSGATPFVADSLPELCAKILTDPPQPLSAKRRDATAALSAAVMKCLEKSRDARYPTVAELAVALAPFGPKRARVSVERISKVMSAAGLSNSQIGAEQPTERPPKAGGTMAAWGQTAPGIGRDRTVTLLATALGGLLLAGAATGVILWSRDRSPSAEPLGTTSVAAPAEAVTEAPAAQPERAATASAAPPPTPAAPVEIATSAAPSAPPPATGAAAPSRTAQKAPATAAKVPATKPPAAAAAKPAAAAPATPAAAPPSRATIFGDRK